MKSLMILPFLALAQVKAANSAADAINEFGVDLHRRLAVATPAGNLVFSPWSIETALAMTWAGARGETAEEMQRVLRFPKGEAMHEGLAAIQADLEAVATRAKRRVARETGATPTQVNVANRLFGQKGFAFVPAFLDFTAKSYGAPLEPVDFQKDPAGATKRINSWVEEQTQKRIVDLIPPGAINRMTELVLANAVYFKAPWFEPFHESPGQPFHVGGAQATSKVTMLSAKRSFGHAQIKGGAAVTIPYRDGGIQFVILRPDKPDGLPALEKALDGQALARLAKTPAAEVNLRFPKFKLEPPSVQLADQLKKMGMTRAFGAADFSGIAPSSAGKSLAISEVVHKAFVAVDKDGTEAAAATAVIMKRTALPVEKPKPIEFLVDRPFVFAIQHIDSGACLFLGRVLDPR